MAEYRNLDVDYFSPDDGKKARRNTSGNGGGKLGDVFRKNKILIFVSAGVIIAVIAAYFLLFAGPKKANENIVDSGVAVKGVFVGGIDISGMTKEKALKATASLEKAKLNTVKFTLDVNGTPHGYGAGDLSVTSDYNDVIQKAIAYAHTGTFEERKGKAQAAIDKPVKYDISLKINESTFKASLDKIKASLDVAPKDASMTFTPWGYTQNADGTISAYNPTFQQIQAMVEAEANRKDYDQYPKVVTLNPDEMPSLMRYEYYENNKYIAGYDTKTNKFVNDGYRPAHANIARFYYSPDVKGLTVDMNAVADKIRSEIKSGTYDKITVPCQNIDPKATLENLKSQTQLITSWTSSFSKSSHYKYNRNWNVSMISALINNGGVTPTAGQVGSELKPGDTWSANTIAGPRTGATSKTIGWKKAAGIENGGTTQQYGGGVCQLGSTTYNAALRSGIHIDSFVHHSIPSDYIPKGVDATLNTQPARDLVLSNKGTSNYYIVSYVNPIEKTVTVEIYGPSLKDASGKDVIYTYISKVTGRYGSADSRTIECSEPTAAPDGTVIDGASCSYYVYADSSRGTYAEVRRLIYSLDGTQISNDVYSPQEKYPPITGTTYVWVGSSPSESPTDGTGTGTQ